MERYDFTVTADSRGDLWMKGREKADAYFGDIAYRLDECTVDEPQLSAYRYRGAFSAVSY